MLKLHMAKRSQSSEWRHCGRKVSVGRLCRQSFALMVIFATGTMHAENSENSEWSMTWGSCSPIVQRTGGSVTINCMGVDPRALQRMNELLDKKDVELTAKVQEAEDWANKYRVLSSQIAKADDGSILARSAKDSLVTGDLERARTDLAELQAQIEDQKREFSATQKIFRESIKDSLEQISNEGVAAGGVFHKANSWAKSVLRICFLDGDRAVRSYVASVAQEWTLYANIDFDFGLVTNPRLCAASEPNDVRVS
jgi:hypothetical protein